MWHLAFGFGGILIVMLSWSIIVSQFFGNNFPNLKLDGCGILRFPKFFFFVLIFETNYSDC